LEERNSEERISFLKEVEERFSQQLLETPTSSDAPRKILFVRKTNSRENQLHTKNQNASEGACKMTSLFVWLMAGDDLL
jgi:hypothetical protein